MKRAPESYRLRRSPGRVDPLLAERAKSLLDAGLGEPESLTRGLARGSVARIRVPNCGEVVVRAYRRGGLLGGLRRGYLSPRRFLRELSTTLEAARRGIPVARPLGVVARRRGWGWLGWAAFESLPGARDLRQALAPPCSPAQAEDHLARALRAVRRAHDLGLAHPDLNLGNLMVSPDPPAVFILDLDRARLGGPRSRRGRFSEIARLDRSLEKLFGHGLLDREARDRLLVGYGAGDAALSQSIRRRLAGHHRRLRLRRLLWRLRGEAPPARV